MPTKTDRILSYLPGTFKALPRPTALYSVIDAFGHELQNAENSLAAIMSSHWVDHADRNAQIILDLKQMAALYGLLPREDETVEEFREHLKRYIRTFLEGTVTVQGLLRVTAEVLSLHINDAYNEMDCWWSRASDMLITTELRGDGAAELVLGVTEISVTGLDEQAACITGSVDLSNGIDLRKAHHLRIKVDASAAVDIDVTATVADQSRVTLDDIVTVINNSLAAAIASHDNHFLTLRSLTIGDVSQLQVEETDQDAAQSLLGLAPHHYQGSAASAATVTGAVDLGSGIDLSDKRYIRITLDGVLEVEIDCAGADPSHTSLDNVCNQINLTLGGTIAQNDGHYLTLTSSTTGAGSSILFRQAAAQDATTILFGSLAAFYSGKDEQPAQLTGSIDLVEGVDLSEQSVIHIAIDDGVMLDIDCAGADPENTQAQEIVTTINRVFAAEIARYHGKYISLVSPSVGTASTIELAVTESNDATQRIFGIGPRQFSGAAATPAQFIGLSDLSAGIDLRGRHYLRLALDDQPPKDIDLRVSASDIYTVSIDEIAAAINTALTVSVASHDGQHLIVMSQTTGARSRIEISPVEETRQRRFVTRAAITDEAARDILGFVARKANGTLETSAHVTSTGDIDLSRGVDLRDNAFLRIGVDGAAAIDIDCRGPRPRATLIEEIVAAINTALGKTIAGHDGKRLILTSLTKGQNSRISLDAAQGEDALGLLMGLAGEIEQPLYRGVDATRVSFIGIKDLSGNVDLSTLNRIKLSIDEKDPIEISFNPVDPAQASLNEIVIAINLALEGMVASHDGRHLVLTSLTTGNSSRIGFEIPADAAADATAVLFGIVAPRLYQGSDAQPAEVRSTQALPATMDLSTRRYLRLAIDNKPQMDIDVSTAADDPGNAQAIEVINAINTALGDAATASLDGSFLRLTSARTGTASRIRLMNYTSSDARSVLLGDVADVTQGTDPLPAVITGDVALTQSVDLSERRYLRIVVDGGRPRDIYVAGVVPRQTFADEIVASINAVYPGMALINDDVHLQLTSPSYGVAASLEIMPLRYLEVMEYPSKTNNLQLPDVRHGQAMIVNNMGAADVYCDIAIQSKHGVVYPAVVNVTSGWQLRVLVVVHNGETLRISPDAVTGIKASVTDREGMILTIPESQLVVAPLAEQTFVPLSESEQKRAVLSLLRGQNRFLFQDCNADRFDEVDFDAAHFAGCDCRDRALFDVSRFNQASFASVPVAIHTVFADNELPNPSADITFYWGQHTPGAVVVNLPVDLPGKYGARFDEARFGEHESATEIYKKAVVEPPTDPDYLVTQLNAQSKLVEATVVPLVPLGWSAVAMPFRKSRTLSLGAESTPARLYLQEEGIDGFIEIKAKQVGEWTNDIAVSARPSGPAMYDVSVLLQAARFENARKLVLGKDLKDKTEDLPVQIQTLLQPGPVGVLQAKAAGVHASVTRDRTKD